MTQYRTKWPKHAEIARRHTFRTFFAYLVAAFVWQLSSTHAHYKRLLSTPESTSYMGCWWWGWLIHPDTSELVSHLSLRECQTGAESTAHPKRAQILKKLNLAWNFQSRLKLSISTSWIPTKIWVWWVARLKISISLENFKILKFFKIWALRDKLGKISQNPPHPQDMSVFSNQAYQGGRLIFYHYWCWRAGGAAPVKASTGNHFPGKYQRIRRNYYQYWC